MEQQAFDMQGKTNLNDEVKTSSHDVDLGLMLDVQSTQEEERKVLQKLDFV